VRWHRWRCGQPSGATSKCWQTPAGAHTVIVVFQLQLGAGHSPELVLVALVQECMRLFAASSRVCTSKQCCGHLLCSASVLFTMLWAAIDVPRRLRIALLCRIGQYTEGEQLGSAQQLLHRIFTTVYMGTENSSADTRRRAATLAEQVGFPALMPVDTCCRLPAERRMMAGFTVLGRLLMHSHCVEQIGSDHLDVNMDSVVSAMAALFAVITGHQPAFRVILPCLQ
jgi:hypothetical protein